MNNQDPIADMLTRIRNANRVGRKLVLIPKSKICIGIAQVLKDAHQPIGIAGMQADARLIEHEQSIDQTRSEARREVHALGFTAGKRARRPIQREVTQADVIQISEARPNFAQGERDGIVRLHRAALREDCSEPQSIPDRKLIKIGES